MKYLITFIPVLIVIFLPAFNTNPWIKLIYVFGLPLTLVWTMFCIYKFLKKDVG